MQHIPWIGKPMKKLYLLYWKQCLTSNMMRAYETEHHETIECRVRLHIPECLWLTFSVGITNNSYLLRLCKIPKRASKHYARHSSSITSNVTIWKVAFTAKASYVDEAISKPQIKPLYVVKEALLPIGEAVSMSTNALRLHALMVLREVYKCCVQSTVQKTLTKHEQPMKHL